MSIWKYAHLSSRANNFDPVNNGWTLIDSNFFFFGDINFIPSEADITEDGIIYPSDSDEELGTEE